MSYSKKVLDHFNNPRNMGSFDKKLKEVGTGMVGAPECGDVMKLQIKVEDDVIVDAKFKTFGCLAGNAPIATPKGYRDISNLSVGDVVWAWNGMHIVETKILSINSRMVDWKQLYKIKFDQVRTVIATHDHVWWCADNRPIETSELAVGMELLHMTERELRSLNNVGRQPWLRDKNREIMKKTNSKIDHSLLPQNKPGYIHDDEFKKKISLASKKMWQSEKYMENWTSGMVGASKKRPTSLEKKFIELFKEHDIDARYVGNSNFWVNVPHENGMKRLNPDFKVNGQRKLIEVYTSALPHFMQNRSTPNWMIERKSLFAKKNFDCMFIDANELDSCIEDVQRFIHNGIPVTQIQQLLHKNELRGTEHDIIGNVKVYDLILEEAHCFFVLRAMSHNCGSAVASSSLATEWLKGKTLEEATKIKNTDIVAELDLPPVKIHCSVLAEDAIKAALADYQKKQEA